MTPEAPSMPSVFDARQRARSLIAHAIARGVDHTEDLDSDQWSQDYRDEMYEGADAVLDLFEVHERYIYGSEPGRSCLSLVEKP